MAPVEEKPRNRTNPGHFGPAVIGEEEYEKEKEMVETGADTFGPAVVDSHPASDEEGNRKEEDHSDDKTVVVQDGAEFTVGQFDMISKSGGWYLAVHAGTGAYLTKDGELVPDEEDAGSFGQGEDGARQQVRETLQEVQETREREKFVENEPGEGVTAASPEEVEEAEQIVRDHQNEEGYLSLEDQQELLEDAEDRLRDRIIDSEFGRADGPRVEGLRNLIDAERDRTDGPRPRVLNRLERAFAQLTADPDS